VNDVRTEQADLQDGSVLMLGSTRVVFRSEAS